MRKFALKAINMFLFYLKNQEKKNTEGEGEGTTETDSVEADLNSLSN